MKRKQSASNTTAPTLTVEEFVDDLSTGYLLIELNTKYLPLKRAACPFIQKFMQFLQHTIACESSLCYHLHGYNNFTIKISPHVNTRTTQNLPSIKVFEQKLSVLQDTFSKLDLSKAKNDTKWLIREIRKLGYNISDLFTVAIYTPNDAVRASEIKVRCMTDIRPNAPSTKGRKTPEKHTLFNFAATEYTLSSMLDIKQHPINIKYPDNIQEAQIKRITLKDSSTITYISDPYIRGYGVYSNLTLPFSEMNYSHNLLHLYEHLMTGSWEMLNKANVTLFNGCTYPNGLCYVFTNHNTLNSTRIFLVADILYRIKSRSDNFWNKLEYRAAFEREIERTISETRHERTLGSPGRSDCSAFDFNYNIPVLTYWSRLPFNYLVIGPDSLEALMIKHDMISKEMEKYPTATLEDKDKPKIRNIKHYPAEVIKLKQNEHVTYSIMHVDTNILKSIMLENKRSNESFSDFKDRKHSMRDIYECSLLGYDNALVFHEIIMNEETRSRTQTSILHPFLFCNRLFTEDEEKELFSKTVFPITLEDIASKSIDTFDINLNNLDLI